MFYPQAFFDWDGEWGPGLPEPTASKWMTNDGFYLWEKSEPKYEDWADEETIQDWAPEEMDAEEVAYVVEEQ